MIGGSSSAPPAARRRSSRLSHVAILAVLAAPIAFSGLANHDFWLPNEPYVAEIAREMAASGDWAIPRLNGEPFLEKPPLLYAEAAACFRIFGVEPFAARIPPALASFLTVLATYFLGARLLDSTTGLWGALILSTVALLVHAGHFCLPDATLSLFVTLGFLAASYSFGDDRSSWALVATYAAAGFAFLAKGPIGPVLLLGGIAAFVVARREWQWLFRPTHVPGITVFAALAGPWVAALWREGRWEFLREAFVANTLGRFVSHPQLLPKNHALGQHVFPFYDYLLSLPLDFLPWTPLLLFPLASAFLSLRHRRLDLKSAGGSESRLQWGKLYLGLTLLLGFVVLSAASTKRGIYLLPLYPQLALLIASSVRREREAPRLPGGLTRALLGSQAVTTTTALLAVAVACRSFSGPLYGDPATEGATAVAVIVAAVALAAAAFLVRAFVMERPTWIFAGLFAQAACSYLALAVFCAPLLDDERGFSGFFRNAVRIEAQRERTPVLFMRNESYVGLADLHFRGLLEGFDPREETARVAGSRDAVDVLTDETGFRSLRSDPDSSVKVLAEGRTKGPGGTRALYLVAWSRAPSPLTAP